MHTTLACCSLSHRGMLPMTKDTSAKRWCVHHPCECAHTQQPRCFQDSGESSSFLHAPLLSSLNLHMSTRTCCWATVCLCTDTANKNSMLGNQPRSCRHLHRHAHARCCNWFSEILSAIRPARAGLTKCLGTGSAHLLLLNLVDLREEGWPRTARLPTSLGCKRSLHKCWSPKWQWGFP